MSHQCLHNHTKIAKYCLPSHSRASAPNNIVTWLQKHPFLKTSGVQPATVGGMRGTRIDVEVSAVPEDYSSLCGDEPCIVLATLKSDEPNAMVFSAAGKSRLTVLRDVEGETVIIGSNAYPASEFDSIVPKGQKVMNSVEWRAGS